MFFFLPIQNVTYSQLISKAYRHWVPCTEAEFTGCVILSLVFVYLLHCSTLSPLRFISSGNIFNFSCLAAFAHCFIACWGCALSIISKVSGENAIKAKLKVRQKLTKAWNNLRRNKNKCIKQYKSQRIRCERHRGIIYQLNVQILPQWSWNIMVLLLTFQLPLVIGRSGGFWADAFVSPAPRQKTPSLTPPSLTAAGVTSAKAAESLMQQSTNAALQHAHRFQQSEHRNFNVSTSR